MDYLAGIHAKLGRANETLCELKREIDIFLDNPAHFKREKGFLVSPLEYTFRISQLTDGPPTKLSILTGEIIHHYRSCLDIMICALVERGGGTLKKQMFPMFISKTGFESKRESYIGGISVGAAAIVEEVQPFQEAQPNASALYFLHDLDIKDKHIIPISIIAKAETGPEFTLDAPTPVEIHRLSGGSPAALTQGGVDLFSFHLNSPCPGLMIEGTIDVEVGIPIQARHQPLVPTIELLRSRVSNILQRLAKELD